MDKFRFTLKKNELVNIMMEELLSTSKIDTAYKVNCLSSIIDGYVENDASDMVVKYSKLFKEYINDLVGFGAFSRFERKHEILVLMAERYHAAKKGQ